MASLLAAYRNPNVLKVAEDLDDKVEAILREVAG
jgi:hypothetical protein